MYGSWVKEKEEAEQMSRVLHLLHPENSRLLLNPIAFFCGPESKVPGGTEARL